MDYRNAPPPNYQGRGYVGSSPYSGTGPAPGRPNAYSAGRGGQLNGQQYNPQVKDVKQNLGFADSSGVYEVDHLATFTLPSNQSQLTPAGAVRKLNEMDTAPSAGQPGVWTMRVFLCVEPQYILVLDATSREEMERFPVSLVSEPACVTPKVNDASVRYNNIVLFTVLEDAGKGSPAEMHLFQCLGGPGQKVVDDIIACMAGKYSASQIREPISKPEPQSIYNQPRGPDAFRDFGPNPEISAQAALRYKPDPAPRQRFRQSTKYPSREGAALREPPQPSSDPAEMAERCVNLLDQCFNDIETFVGKLQQAAVAYNELDRRKTVRGNKNSKQIGDGLLGMRSKPPPAKDFYDILQKFKLSFILLAKLRTHIRDPNSPELVHFLFNPLGLVVEASRSSGQGVNSDLVSRVISPVLTRDARELLDNCLTTKEMELWKSLGPAWTTSSDRWEGDVQPYAPQFYDGWQPPQFWLEDIGVPSIGAIPGASMMGPPTLYSKFPAGRNTPANNNGGYQVDQSRRVTPDAGYLSSDSQDFVDSERNYAVERVPVQPQYVPPASPAQSQPVAVEEKAKPKKQWKLFGGSSSTPKTEPEKVKEEKPKINEKVAKKPVAVPAVAVKPSAVEVQPIGGVYAPAAVGYASPPSAAVGYAPPPSAAVGYAPPPSGGGYNGVPQDQGPQDQFAKELQSTGARAYRVIQDRVSSNPKELSIKSGEIVEVLDDSRNWWNVRNSRNETGFAPKTILERL